MKCFFCRKETKDVIRCEDCVGRVAAPMMMFKGGGWTGVTAYTQVSGQSKTFDKKKAPSYKDLEKHGYLDYVKKNNEKVKSN